MPSQSPRFHHLHDRLFAVLSHNIIHVYNIKSVFRHDEESRRASMCKPSLPGSRHMYKDRAVAAGVMMSLLRF